MMIFNGNLLAEKIKGKLVNDGKLVGKTLVIFKTGNEEGVYVRLKRKMGEELGVRVEVSFGGVATLKLAMTSAIKDDSVSGILVQLPIAGVNETERDEILRMIPPEKDVDGLNPDGSNFLPAAVLAVERILKRVQDDAPHPSQRRAGSVQDDAPHPSQRRAGSVQDDAPHQSVQDDAPHPSQRRAGSVQDDIGVVGSKGMVGKALVKRFRAKGFDVGDDLFELKNFDVVVSATGEAGIIKPEMVKNGVIAIDLGYPKGDFDERVKEKASFITPVPGGVGPVTVVSLFENLSKTGYNNTS